MRERATASVDSLTLAMTVASVLKATTKTHQQEIVYHTPIALIMAAKRIVMAMEPVSRGERRPRAPATLALWTMAWKSVQSVQTLSSSTLTANCGTGSSKSQT